MNDAQAFDLLDKWDRRMGLMRGDTYGTLRDAYLNGRIDAAEFEQRLDAVLALDPRAIERWDGARL